MIPRNRKITEISKYGGSVPIGECAIDLHDPKPLNLNTQVCEGNLTKLRIATLCGGLLIFAPSPRLQFVKLPGRSALSHLETWLSTTVSPS